MAIRVEVPLVVKDPLVTDSKDVPPMEAFVIAGEDFFLDGPIARRVALLDFDSKTGILRPGVRFATPAAEGESGSYVPSPETAPGDALAREAASVSVFGTVFKTLTMFEERDALGRRIEWAFDAPQLLVVPRAGELANAFYERESHSLQFFSFAAPDGRVVHTSQSQDIVSHETAHAILDGIAPDLYNSISPQSLGIHEAVADLTALLSAFRSKELSRRILRDTGGRIDRPTAFSGIAPQFAEALEKNRHYLRNLFNRKSLRPDAPAADRVDAAEPHGVSEVLSGALYGVMVKIYDSLRAGDGRPERARPTLVEPAESAYTQVKHGVGRAVEDGPNGDSGGAPEDTALKTLFVASERFKRILYRGLDYLPPGDVTLADLGRAIIASDQASHPDSGEQRDWLGEEFSRRGIVARTGELRVRTDYSHPAVDALDLESLVASDWAAYRFANENRDLLRIPRDVPFEVRPRLDVTKIFWHRDGEHQVRECLLKVLWNRVERNPVGGGLPVRRRITLGTTLAIDWATRRIRAVLTSEADAQKEDRTRLLSALLDAGVLRLGEEACGADGAPLHGAIRADAVQGVLRIRGAARVLHVNPVGGP